MPKKATTNGPQDFALKAIAALNEGATSTKAYQLGEHREHTWGIKIPSLAFQWMIGGSNVFPCQRQLSISGPPASLKSTLGVEIGTWFVLDSGLYVPIDNESKTSATMLEAITWWKLTPEQLGRIIFKETENVEEWMKQVSALVKFAKEIGYPTKGGRLPVFALVDSLTGKASEAEQEAVEKEGFAAGRAFPVKQAMISRFLEALQLTHTTMALGYVRHLKQTIDASGPPGMPPPQKESGGAAAQFKASLSIRVMKGQGLGHASHPAMPHSTSVEGYRIYLTSDKSCLGPDKRKIEVDVLWQYVPQEDGTSKQLMKYDWDGALGWLLWAHKYDEKFGAYADDKERLDKVLKFSQGNVRKVNCAALGLENATLTELGAAIMKDPELVQKVSNFLNITQYRSVQDVDLEAPPKAA